MAIKVEAMILIFLSLFFVYISANTIRLYSRNFTIILERSLCQLLETDKLKEE